MQLANLATTGAMMDIIRKATTFLALALLSSAVQAVSDDQLFDYAEAIAPDTFIGPTSAGRYLRGTQEYNYRFYQGSGNYLAIDPAGMIYVTGMMTDNKLVAVGPVTAFADFVTAWKSRAPNPAQEAAHDVGESAFGGLVPPVIGRIVSQTDSLTTYQALSPEGLLVGNLIVDINGKLIASERLDATGDPVEIVPERDPYFLIRGTPPRIVAREILDQDVGVIGYEIIDVNGVVTRHEISPEYKSTYRVEGGRLLGKDGLPLTTDQ